MNSEVLIDSERDAESVLAVRQGDAERYRELVERHQRRVFAVAWSRLGDTTLAEEATQEAFIRGYRQLERLGNAAKFAGWITAIARHVAINLGLSHRRELDRRARWALENAEPWEGRADEPAQPCTPELLRHTLQRMPAAHRECLVLFYLEGKSGAEAAATLGIAEGTFRVRLHRAKVELREQLQARLEESLESLRPAKAVPVAVMAAVLASSSAKAATFGAAGAGLGTKLLSSVGASALWSWLMPLFSLVGTLPGLFASWFYARAEQRNFRDRDGIRPQLHRRFFRSFLWGFPMAVLLIAVLNHSVAAAWGMRGVYLWLSCLLLALTLISARSLLINRHPFQVGSFCYCLLLAIGVWALGLGWIPSALSQLPIVLGSILWLFLIGHRPARMDYSLFLRGAQGLLHTSGGTSALPSTTQTRSSLLSFARFLGERFLVNNYKWEVEGLSLRAAPARAHFAKSLVGVFLPVWRQSSRIVLGWDGLVTAHCGPDDAATLSELLLDGTRTAVELEGVVAGAVQEAWGLFRSGNFPAAAQGLGELPDAEVFAVPPARAMSTRILQWLLGAATALLIIAMVAGYQRDRLRMVSGSNLKPVEVSEAEVRASLAQLATSSNATAMAKDLIMAGQTCEVLPPRELFTDAGWQVLQTELRQREFLHQDQRPATALDWFLGYPALQGVFLNGWVSAADLQIAGDSARRQLVTMASMQERFSHLESIEAVNQDRTPAGYSVLDTQNFARRVRSLKRLSWLNLVNGSNTVATLLKHQVLSGGLPYGRRQVVDPKLLHGTFLTFGFDPLQDTWEALAILDAFGALNRVDREACIRGILRFHHGKGLFGSVREGDSLVILGDTRDTLCAYESLRMLDGLNRVRDLEEWRFRPLWTPVRPSDRVVHTLNERELEAWVCQDRLNRFLREHKAHPQAPRPSLLEP